MLHNWIHHHCHHATTPDARDTMHIRKPSSSDSVSSLSSASTTSSTVSSPTQSHHRQHSRVIEFDPLCLNPTFRAPPRLSERPFKQQDVEFEHPRPIRKAPTRELQLPPVSSPASNHDRNQEAPDYFHLKLELLRRPTLQRSHWSESTIQTVEVDMEEDVDDEQSGGGVAAEHEEVSTPTATTLQFEYGERLARPVTAERWQNFSYKRNTVPRRPPMTTGDSIENYIKRGGWKRRGIVFQQNQGEEGEGESTDRYSAHTVI